MSTAVSFDLRGKTAIVTGAGRGMGRAIAVEFARHGARVAVQDIELAVAEAAVEEIRSAGGDAHAFGGDATDLAFADTLYEAVRARLPGGAGVQILVNNAAVQHSGDWTTMPASTIEWQYRGNVITPWFLSRRCVADMRPAKWGRILNVSSLQGRRGVHHMLGYSMTKAALDNMTTGLARELAAEGITVNAIAPGYFDTHRNRDQFTDEATKRERGAWIPAKRVGESHDVCGAALLLCSDAGAYITGQVLDVDGGMSLR